MVSSWLRRPISTAVGVLDERDPAFIARFIDVVEPVLWRWFRPEVRGLERIPAGAALYVGNHSGGFATPDTWIFGAAVYRARGIGDVPYGLGHSLVMESRWPGEALSRMGGLRATAENAHHAFVAGGKVLVYPGGDLDAFRASRDRERVIFGPRRGYLRLAVREGVPIVPVVSAGAHDGFRILSDGRWLARLLPVKRILRTEVLPITLSFPWGLTVGAPPYVPVPTKILIEALEPIRFERAGEEASRDDAYVEECHRRVIDAMQGALERLSHERRRARDQRLVDRLGALADILER